jgi:hypothetical protein
MRQENVKIGDKVVPFQKTYSTSGLSYLEWLNSSAGQNFKKDGFATITHIINDIPYLNGSGAFNFFDFKPYSEPQKQNPPYSHLQRSLLNYCRATGKDTAIVDMLFKKPQDKPTQPIKEKFVPHLICFGTNRGEIGKPTGKVDAVGQPLFVGDTVTVYDDGLSKCESPICFDNNKFEIMGIYGSFENPRTAWKWVKKRSFEDISNGEVVRNVKYVRCDE